MTLTSLTTQTHLTLPVVAPILPYFGPCVWLKRIFHSHFQVDMLSLKRCILLERVYINREITITDVLHPDTKATVCILVSAHAKTPNADVSVINHSGTIYVPRIMVSTL